MNFLNYLLSFEIFVNASIQQWFQPFEYFLEIVSVYFGPSMLMDIWLAFFGAFDMNLMLQLNIGMGVMNVVSSVIKWVYPEDRPFWWVREFHGPELRQHPVTCETTSGFPSGHSIAFTGFTYIVALHVIPPLQRMCNASKSVELIILALLVVLSSLTWISRMYFACHFLHQCLIGSLMALVTINLIEKRKTVIFEMNKKMALGIVVSLGLFVIAMYFAILKAGFDPHWSVRMAFKWCEDPGYLKHEHSPIFSLCRDFGFLIGIALSAPLGQRNQRQFNRKLSVPVTLAFEALNFYIRQNTPKQRGRFVFVAYEFLRNAFHSYTLLNIIPKICGSHTK